jgi:glycosyltransferase involved in cell wall biosynthesis
MSESVRVVCIGPSVRVCGGISRLIEKLRDVVPKNIQFRVIATHSAYIGDAKTKRWVRWSQPGLYLLSLARVLTAAIAERRTIFHVHFSQRGSTLRKGIICVLLRALHCRYIVQAHASEDALFHNWVPSFVRRILLWGIGGGRYLIALTQFWRDYYAVTLNISADKLVILPNPADIPQVIPNRTHRERLELLFLGRVGERKGAFDLIHAFAALPNTVREQCHLTFAGDGETDAARNLASKLGCSSQTSILGWVRPLETNRLLVEADVFLLPSRGEGMSMALLEAMAWGLPVVTTVSGGTDEFLSSYHNCVLVKPGDIHSIAEALHELVVDPKLRLRLGMEARRTAESFSIDQYTVKLAALYEQLASDPLESNRTQAVFTAKS